LAASRALFKAGSSIAMRMLMMPMTTSNSTNVNPAILRMDAPFQRPQIVKSHYRKMRETGQ
jgi:hypothetical protein